MAEITSGDELRAVRCGLGCLGILVEVRLACRPRYLVRESVHPFETLPDLLSDLHDHPLSFFIMAPHSGQLVSWRRSPVEWRPLTSTERYKAFLYRLYKFLNLDLAFHLVISLIKHTGLNVHRAFFSRVAGLMLTDRPVLDESEPQLTMAHDLFRHEEMEIFVRAQVLPQALQIVDGATSVFAGDEERLSDETAQVLRGAGVLESLYRLRGSYLHHYPFVMRRVLPEDTMISMAGGRDTWFSISVFTYSEQRDSYYRFCYWLADALNQTLGARLHWGKHCPLSSQSLEPVYPELAAFRELCRKHDPRGVFRSDYVDQVLGFSPRWFENLNE